jgi:dsRNA-specific ribonuclease
LRVQVAAGVLACAAAQPVAGAPLQGEGQGCSKRAAEQDAARVLLWILAGEEAAGGGGGGNPGVPGEPAAARAAAAGAEAAAAAHVALDAAAGALNPKGALQELLMGAQLAAALRLRPGQQPEYVSGPRAGLDHAPRFRERVRVTLAPGGGGGEGGCGEAGVLEAAGEASTRKGAQAAAAAQMLAQLLARLELERH